MLGHVAGILRKKQWTCHVPFFFYVIFCVPVHTRMRLMAMIYDDDDDGGGGDDDETMGVVCRA